MNLSTQPVKGARDFYPEEMRLQKYIFSTWRTACERFGYEEYDAPILEPTELYLNKGNQEIINEQTYTFTDRGGRSLTIRTEMTPSVSRMVAGKRQELGYPQRLYSIPQCWRYERMQRGRGREFYQLNADVFGLSDLAADIEVIKLSDSIMQAFGARRETYQIKVNSRKLVDHLLEEVMDLKDEAAADIRTLIDKKDKISRQSFDLKLTAILEHNGKNSPDVVNALKGFLASSSLEELPSELSAHDSVKDLRDLLESLRRYGVSNISFEPSLMRGFDYYTDIAFEVFDVDPENNRSMFGGGRYEGLVGMFGTENVSAVGFGMGDITLANFLKSHGLVPKLAPATQLYVCGLSEGAEVLADSLRKEGVNVALDSSGRPVKKQIRTAEKLGIRYFVVVGDEELSNEVYNLKDILRSHEMKVARKDLPDFFVNQ